MIRLRVRSPFESEWTEVALEGEDEESSYHILAATLMRLEWTVYLSRDGGEFLLLGEDEEPLG